MRIRGIVVTLLAAVALAPAPAGAVPVETGQHTIFDTHVSGMPSTAEPSRTLRAVSAETDWRTGEVAVTAALAATASPSSQVSVTWNLGRWSAAGTECVAEKTLASSTVGGPASDTLSTIQTFSDIAHDYTCLDVSLTTGGVVSDRMRDTWVTRISYSGAEADLVSTFRASPTPTRVVAGTPTRTLALVTSHVLSSSRVALTGSGTARLEPVVVTGLAADEVRPVVVRVTAPAVGRSRIDVQARDERGDADYDGSSAIKAVRAHGRPEAGRYTSADGTVKLRVDRRFRVRGLVGAAGGCGSQPSTQVRLGTVGRLPRSGATAVAREVDGGWSAVSLVTLGDRKISGVLVHTTPECALTVPFVVRAAH